MKKIELVHSSLWHIDPVLYLTFKDGAELDVPEIREIIVSAEKLCGKKPYLLFSDACVHLSITPEGRKVAADGSESPFVAANAVLVNNTALRLIANVFKNFNKPHFPYRVFSDRKKALHWLLNHPLDKSQ